MPFYLIDASVYVFRAYFSLPETLCDAQGRPANALRGFGDFLIRFLSRTTPTRIAMAFDESLETSFRNAIWPAYKANREPAPPELKAQFARCRELCRGFGIAEFAHPGFEADDLIGTLATIARRNGYRIVIVSRDKDLLQLLREGDEMWDYAADRHWGPDEVRRHYGIGPDQMADYLALVGDAADNIPGVSGIGPKRGAQLLQTFGNLQEIHHRLDEVEQLPLRGAARIAATLAASHDQTLLYRQLTGIVTDMPIPDAFEQTVWQVPERTQLRAALAAVGLPQRWAERL